MAQIRVYGNGVSPVPLKRFFGIQGRGTAHVSTFGVENDRNFRVMRLDVAYEFGQLIFCPQGSEMGSLRLKCRNVGAQASTMAIPKAK